jgi:hypothetical protein
MEGNQTVSMLLGQVVFTLFSGPLAEEDSWRGFSPFVGEI